MANPITLLPSLKLFSPLLGSATSLAEHLPPLPGASRLLAGGGLHTAQAVPVPGATSPPPPSFQLASSYLSFHSAGYRVRPSQGCSLAAQQSACPRPGAYVASCLLISLLD